MSSRFQNKYRIPSARLQTWNYGNAGMYFITICTKNRDFYFGEIINEQMNLSDIGKIAETEWLKTVGLRPDMNLELGEFIVMPNHMHGIILIGKNQYNSNNNNDDGGRNAMHCVSADEKTNNSNKEDKSVNQFGPQSKNLASILRGYKSAVTTFSRKNKIEFDWQARYHDHIIWSMDEYFRISNYIINNVVNWKNDRFFK